MNSLPIWFLAIFIFWFAFWFGWLTGETWGWLEDLKAEGKWYFY